MVALISIRRLVDLAPRDDIESLVLVAPFLLRGNLPCKPRPRLEQSTRGIKAPRMGAIVAVPSLVPDEYPHYRPECQHRQIWSR